MGVLSSIMKKLTLKELTALKSKTEAATPGPWFWNSYSCIFSEHFTPTTAEEEDNIPDYPNEPRPGSQPGHEWFDEADNAWLAQRKAAYLADSVVASVPAHYGDTATDRHAADAELIAACDPQTISDLVEEILEWRSKDNQALAVLAKIDALHQKWLEAGTPRHTGSGEPGTHYAGISRCAACREYRDGYAALKGGIDDI
jgi:hypothetical protein